MNERFQRQALLTGKGATEALAGKHVIVFGVGGVGGYCCEALARCGIGSLTLVDNDTVSLSNINRQIIALTSTVGQYKTDVMAKRINDINPDCTVTTYNIFLTPENLSDFYLEDVDYVADCIDTVTSKLALAEFCFKNGIPVISAMGAGNKLTSEGFAVRDLFKTEGCPLAKVMRRELKKRGVTKLKTVSSPTLPLKPFDESEISDENLFDNSTVNFIEEKENSSVRKRQTPGSISFVPSVCGLIMAEAIITDILGL